MFAHKIKLAAAVLLGLACASPAHAQWWRPSDILPPGLPNPHTPWDGRHRPKGGSPSGFDPVVYNFGIRNTTSSTVYYTVNGRPAQMGPGGSTRFNAEGFNLGFNGGSWNIPAYKTVTFFVANDGSTQGNW